MLSTVEKVLILKAVDLFSEIPGRDLARIAQVTEELVVGRAESLMKEGELGDSLFILVEGEVEVRKGRQAIAQLGPGECVGEMALLDSEPRSATVRAAEDVRVLRLDRDAFDELMDGHVDIARGVIRVLTRRLRLTTAEAAVPLRRIVEP